MIEKPNKYERSIFTIIKEPHYQQGNQSCYLEPGQGICGLWMARNANVLGSYIPIQLPFSYWSPPEGLWKLENSTCIKEKLPQPFTVLRNLCRLHQTFPSHAGSRTLARPFLESARHRGSLVQRVWEGTRPNEAHSRNPIPIAAERPCRLDHSNEGWLGPRQPSALGPPLCPPPPCPRWPAPAETPWRDLQRVSPLTDGYLRKTGLIEMKMYVDCRSLSLNQIDRWAKKTSCWFSLYIFLVFPLELTRHKEKPVQLFIVHELLIANSFSLWQLPNGKNTAWFLVILEVLKFKTGTCCIARKQITGFWWKQYIVLVEIIVPSSPLSVSLQ